MHSNHCVSILCFRSQVVLKVRKRITLMVISVTVIFGICWNARATLHLATSYSSFSTSGLTLRIAHMMLMFNAAVNIFAYVLISQRFRVKIKKNAVSRRGFRKSSSPSTRTTRNGNGCSGADLPDN